MAIIDRITVDPEIMAGKPIINGTRIPVEVILEQLGQGWSVEEVLHGYPQLSREDILACIQYAKKVVESEIVFPA